MKTMFVDQHQSQSDAEICSSDGHSIKEKRDKGKKKDKKSSKHDKRKTKHLKSSRTSIL